MVPEGEREPMCAIAPELSQLSEHVAGQALPRARNEDAVRSGVDDRSDIIVHHVLVHDVTVPHGTDMKRESLRGSSDIRAIGAGQGVDTP